MSDSLQLCGVLLSVAYDGTPFSGFARQPRARTVAGELDGAVCSIDPGASLVRGASRTDAGVHALAQPVAFDTRRSIEPSGWVLALLRELPREISVTHAARAELGYDPRRHALTKTYRYVIHRSSVRDPFLSSHAWRIGERLNQQLMAEEALDLLGEHDFRAFRAAADERENTVRRLVRAEVRSAGGDPRCLEIVVEGDRFLYKMMRVIAGTLVDVGRGRLPPGAVKRALCGGTRESLGMTAPAQGLFLDRVTLDDSGREPWQEPSIQVRQRQT